MSELSKYVGADLSIPEADVGALYPIKAVEYDVRHKFDGIGARCAAICVEVQGSAAAVVENGNTWMATDVFSRHMSAENERRAAGRLVPSTSPRWFAATRTTAYLWQEQRKDQDVLLPEVPPV